MEKAPVQLQSHPAAFRVVGQGEDAQGVAGFCFGIQIVHDALVADFALVDAQSGVLVPVEHEYIQLGVFGVQVRQDGQLLLPKPRFL